jgi:metal-responsive CopG/Arc/MetJ family transcriptional regulator
MHKVLISLPDDLVDRMKAIIPSRQRSKIIAKVLEFEIKKREKELYKCAKEVEADEELSKEMAEWETTTGDHLESETW